jgi:hypothetical protein
MTYCLFGDKVRLSKILGLGDGEYTRSTPVLVVFRRDLGFCFLGGNKVEFCEISSFDIGFFFTPGIYEDFDHFKFHISCSVSFASIMMIN